jgi:DUF4097 and DUF4098 domain-containing protein YvlB
MKQDFLMFSGWNEFHAYCVLTTARKTMRSVYLLPIIAAGLLTFTACDFDDIQDFERFTSDFHYSYPLSPNGRLSLETFNGSIDVSGWDQNTIDISGTKSGPSQQAAHDLPVSIDHTADAVSIRVVRPSDRRNHQGARFVIKIPRSAILERLATSNGAIRTADGAGPSRFRTSNGTLHVQALHGNLDAQTSNGTVELLDIEGDVVAHTSNGRVRAERLRGTLEATSSNGSIVADLLRADRPVRLETSNSSVDLSLPPDYARDVRASTSNGGITVRLPPTLSARVLARTSNSSISSDFDLQMRGEISKQHLDAVIGNGGPLIDLSTSNGGIRLAKR